MTNLTIVTKGLKRIFYVNAKTNLRLYFNLQMERFETDSIFINCVKLIAKREQ